MPKKEMNMELGNFICRFGGSKVLIDLIDEIVLPAFLDKELIRTYGKTSFFFYDVELVNITKSKNRPVLGIVGRIIKDTTLEREQIYEEGRGLIKDSTAIRSSPSAIFLLILNNHRLIYLKETRDAPSKETFGQTILNFIRNKHKKFIDDKYEELNQNSEQEKITKKDLKNEYPHPSLEIVALTSDESIENFVKKYDLLKTIEIKFSDRNDETDNDPFFEQLQNKKDAIGSQTSTLKHHNKDGLAKDEAIKEIQDAAEQGNQIINLTGIDSEGDKLRGNNEKFQLKKTVDGLTGNIAEDAPKLYASFVSLVNDGIIKVAGDTDKVTTKLQAMLGRYFQ